MPEVVAERGKVQVVPPWYSAELKIDRRELLVKFGYQVFTEIGFVLQCGELH
jgi:hypothetical protein